MWSKQWWGVEGYIVVGDEVPEVKEEDYCCRAL